MKVYWNGEEQPALDVSTRVDGQVVWTDTGPRPGVHVEHGDFDVAFLGELPAWAQGDPGAVRGTLRIETVFGTLEGEAIADAVAMTYPTLVEPRVYDIRFKLIGPVPSLVGSQPEGSEGG